VWISIGPGPFGASAFCVACKRYAVRRMRVGLAPPIVAVRGWAVPCALIGFLSAPPRYRLHPRVAAHISGRGLRIAVPRVFKDRLRHISRGSPAGETVNVPLLHAGRDFIVGPDPPTFPVFPLLSCGPALRLDHPDVGGPYAPAVDEE
jgi:hypothetical protein